VSTGTARAFSWRFALLLAVSTLGTLSNGALAPVLPVFIERELGGDDGLVGLLVAVSPFFALVGGLLAGPRVDAVGRRAIALAGLVTALAGALLLVPAEGPVPVAVARMLFGVGGGVSSAALITWAVDHVPAERRGRALSVFGMTVWIGLSAGPQLGQAMADATSFRGVWLMVVGFEATALALALAGREVRRAGDGEPAVSEEPGAVGRVSTGWRRLVPRGSGRPALLIAAAAYGEGVITAFLVLQLIDRGVHPGAGFGGAASVFTIFAAAVLVFRILVAHQLDRHPPERIAMGGFVLEAMGLAVIAVASSFAPAALGAAIMGAGFAVLFPALALVTTESASPDERGAALGSFGAAFGLGLALGSLLGGAISGIGGTGAAHWSAAAVTAGAAVHIALRSRRVPVMG
jgi:MFS family permease